MRRVFALMMSAIMTICTLLVPAQALAEQYNDPMTVVMPRYGAGMTANMPRLNSSVTTSSSSYQYSGATYYTKGRQLYTPVRDDIAQHNSSTTFRYLSDSSLSASEIMELAEEVVTSACSDELSVDSVDGDYGMWSLSQYSVDYDRKVSGDKYCYTITVDLGYYTTAQQESQVDEAIQSFKSTINTATMTDYQIVKKVHDYICSKATYNKSAIYAGNSLLFDFKYCYSAYGALIKGSCVCQGYAQAFYRICKELGYNCRFVSSDPEEGCHAWNIIQLDGKYYFVDCTWDDEDNNDDYFLVDYDSLRADDTEYREHTLESRYSTQYFSDKYKSRLARDDYDPNGANQLSTCLADLDLKSTYHTGTSVAPNIRVKNGSTALVKGTDYTVTYANNNSAGIGEAVIRGLGEYAGSAARRTFLIKPKKVTGLKVKSGTTTSSAMELSWSASPGATKYVVEKYSGSQWSKLKSVTTNSCQLKSLSSATSYKLRVKAYNRVYRAGYYSSSNSSLTTATKPKNVSISSLTAGKRELTARWSKTRCTGYQIRYSRHSDFSSSTKVNVGSSYSSKRIKKLTSGKKYYVKVRAYKTYTVNGKKHYVYSSWSSKKTIKVK